MRYGVAMTEHAGTTTAVSTAATMTLPEFGSRPSSRQDVPGQRASAEVELAGQQPEASIANSVVLGQSAAGCASHDVGARVCVFGPRRLSSIGTSSDARASTAFAFSVSL